MESVDLRVRIGLSGTSGTLSMDEARKGGEIMLDLAFGFLGAPPADQEAGGSRWAASSVAIFPDGVVTYNCCVPAGTHDGSYRRGRRERSHEGRAGFSIPHLKCESIDVLNQSLQQQHRLHLSKIKA